MGSKCGKKSSGSRRGPTRYSQDEIDRGKKKSIFSAKFLKSVGSLITDQQIHTLEKAVANYIEREIKAVLKRPIDDVHITAEVKSDRKVEKFFADR